MCGCLGAEQRGHDVSVVAVAFQFARRERVLERDIFRFGTATSVPLLFGVLGRVRALRRAGQRLQGGPPRIDGLVMVLRVRRQGDAAFDAQPRAVLPAHRLERQGRHHCVPHHGLEVE